MNPYFNQSQEWKEFFLKANDKPHDVISIEHEEFQILVYQYPFFGKNKFWYVPRLYIYNPQFDVNQYRITTEKIIQKIISESKINKISYITFDIDNRLLEQCNYNSINDFETKFQNSPKKLQYLQTPILDVTKLNSTNLDTIQDFFKANEKSFFGKVNKTCRNLTRRSLEKNWQYLITKDSIYFEQFWSLWQKTAKKHSFNLHPKQYILDLLSFDWADLILILDEKGNVESGGIVITIGQSTIHLYGTNSEIGLERGSQYFFHVVALKYINDKQLNGNDITTYDLGGSDDDGYGNFKKSYKPDYLEFDGPYDYLLDTLIVGVYKGIRKLKSLIK